MWSYLKGSQKLIDKKEDTEGEKSEEDESLNEEEVLEETTESDEQLGALTCNAGDSFKWRGGCGIPYHLFTRLKLIVPHNSSKSNPPEDLQSNFPLKGKLYSRSWT
ncbi:hypothetical protein O181_039736 [Austropuccinia psidii MF-1]|uniref:Uncharacterized protein n=1 Tax=Austropuccinia psidii MF-1 TaxID=1389203 RepID=A0A9Q3HCS4_9BASI|nr:hypothetical protein [Austropuccinia psidii MF-1]